jgi:hypothetical protein
VSAPSPSAFEAAAPHLERLTQAIKVERPHRRTTKGWPQLTEAFLTHRFGRSLDQALDAVRSDLASTGVTSEAKLRAAVAEAYRLLDKSTITVSAWTLQVFEIIGPELPEVALVERGAVKEVGRLVYGFVGRGRPGATFANGYGTAVDVTRPFTSIDAVTEVRVLRPNATSGIEHVARGHVLANATGQILLVPSRYTTRAARDNRGTPTAPPVPRLADGGHPPGSVLTYLDSSGRTTAIDLKQLVEARVPISELLQRPNNLDQVGALTGGKARASLAADDNGVPCVRIVIPVATGAVRTLLHKLLRDRSWQR